MLKFCFDECIKYNKKFNFLFIIIGPYRTYNLFVNKTIFCVKNCPPNSNIVGKACVLNKCSKGQYIDIVKVNKVLKCLNNNTNCLNCENKPECKNKLNNYGRNLDSIGKKNNEEENENDHRKQKKDEKYNYGKEKKGVEEKNKENEEEEDDLREDNEEIENQTNSTNPDHKLFKNVCSQCNNTCLTCYGPSSLNCLTCKVENLN